MALAKAHGPEPIRALLVVHRTKRGFTLPELMIVLSLVSVIASVTGPKLADAFRQRSVGAAADQFVLAHSLARSTALRYGRVAELRIDHAAARFWVEVDSSGSGTRDTVGLVHDVAEGGVYITSTRSVLCFDARGLATTSGPVCQPGDARVAFLRAGKAVTVRVTALGKVLR